MAFFTSPMAIPIVSVLAVFSWFIISSVAESMASVARHRVDAELKQTLAMRGMNAEEIERVINAGKKNKKESGRSEHGLAAITPPDLRETVAMPPVKQRA
jgi:hypothetical protein